MVQTVATRLMERALFVTLRHPSLDVIATRGYAALAGLAAAGRALPADAACCTGPWGTGQCPAGYCAGSACAGPAHYIVGFCAGSAPCWSAGGSCGTCCDCEYVYDDGTVYQNYYCYCNG